MREATRQRERSALQSLTTGTYNTALLSLLWNTDGQFNTAIGAGALLANVGSQDAFYGSRNTAVGAAALLSYRVESTKLKVAVRLNDHLAPSLKPGVKLLGSVAPNQSRRGPRPATLLSRRRPER